MVVDSNNNQCEKMKWPLHLKFCSKAYFKWSGTFYFRTQENVMLENVRKGHPQLSQPEVMELTQDLPSPKDVYSSYYKLRDLCTPGKTSQSCNQVTTCMSTA